MSEAEPLGVGGSHGWNRQSTPALLSLPCAVKLTRCCSPAEATMTAVIADLCCDKVPRKQSLREEGFIVARGFRGFHRWPLTLLFLDLR